MPLRNELLIGTEERDDVLVRRLRPPCATACALMPQTSSHVRRCRPCCTLHRTLLLVYEGNSCKAKHFTEIRV